MYLCYYTDYITTNGDFGSFFNVFVVGHSPRLPTTVTTSALRRGTDKVVAERGCFTVSDRGRIEGGGRKKEAGFRDGAAEGGRELKEKG